MRSGPEEGGDERLVIDENHGNFRVVRQEKDTHGHWGYTDCVVVEEAETIVQLADEIAEFQESSEAGEQPDEGDEQKKEFTAGTAAFQNQLKQFLIESQKAELTPAEIIDYFAVEVCAISAENWACDRAVSEQAVMLNVNGAQEKIDEWGGGGSDD